MITKTDFFIMKRTIRTIITAFLIFVIGSPDTIKAQYHLMARSRKIEVGFRTISLRIVGINAVMAEGEISHGSTEGGVVSVGGNIPAISVTMKREEVALQQFMSTDITQKISQ
jgi:hypothetical protein